MKLQVRVVKLKLFQKNKSQEQSNIYFFDTSALLNDYPLSADNNNIISVIVFEELEKIKLSDTKNFDIKYKARSLIRYLLSHRDLWVDVDIQFQDKDINNDKKLILQAQKIAKHTYHQKINFITSDAAQYLRAINIKELNVIYYREHQEKENLWTGFKDITYYLDEDFNKLYDHPENNTLQLLPNEYCILRNMEGTIVDLVKWDGQTSQIIKYKNLNSTFFGKIQPLNIQQKFLFDLLQNRNIGIKLVRGQFGSGKTFLAIAHALTYVDAHKFDKIVFIRNNVEVAGSQKLGALPGEQEDKLLPFLMPLADHLGSVDYMRQCIDEGKIEPIHLGYLRGRNFENSIIFVDEAENLTVDNVKLIIGRCGKNSEVWFLGDESQTDSDIFRKNNGIAALIQSLKGNIHFGTVELQKSERSEIAQLAAVIK